MIQGDGALTSLPVFAPELDADPHDLYGYYARFRDAGRLARGASSSWGSDDHLVLLRFDDVSTWLRDLRLIREWRRLLPPGSEVPRAEPNTFFDVANNFMLFRDPPDHTRLRTTSNMAFTPRHVARMREPITAMASDLAVAMREREEPVDLITEFAYLLPVLVITGVLGVPETDYPRFRDWAAVIAAAIDLPVRGAESLQRRADQTTRELVEYFGWIVRQRREDPQDDLISSLIAAEAAEGKIDEKELISTLILLLVAGHETTVNLIGSGTLALLRHPDQWKALVDDLSLARNATEELLRYDSPVQLTARFVGEDMEIAGMPVRRGTEVVFGLGAANRDPRAFDEPDRLDIRRDVGRIMSFGMGIHFCLGAPLARLEGEIAFATLARRFPALSLSTDTITWRPGAVFRALREVPLMLS